MPEPSVRQIRFWPAQAACQEFQYNRNVIRKYAHTGSMSSRTR